MRSVAFCLIMGLLLGCSARSGSLAPRPMAARHLSSEVSDEAALRRVTSVSIRSIKFLPAALECAGLLNTEALFKEALANETTIKVNAANERSDAYLSWQIYNCKERVGSNIGISSPASISFMLRATSANGQEIWKAEYSRYDQALSDNLLNLPDTIAAGARWLTVTELTTEGLRTALRDFEAQRVNKLIR